MLLVKRRPCSANDAERSILLDLETTLLWVTQNSRARDFLNLHSRPIACLLIKFSSLSLNGSKYYINVCVILTEM